MRHVSQRVNVVNIHFWGALLDRAPHQTRVVELLPELHIEMSLPLSFIACSLVEAFDLEGVLGHLKVDLEPIDKCVSDPGRVTAVREVPPTTAQARPEADKDADRAKDGLLRDEYGFSTLSNLGGGVQAAPSNCTSPSPGKVLAGDGSPSKQDNH